MDGVTEHIPTVAEGKVDEFHERLQSPTQQDIAIAKAVMERVHGHLTDTLFRHGAQLSSYGFFPDQQHDGIPTSVSFDMQGRQEIDTRWTALFNMQDARDSIQRYFKVVDQYNAVTFEQYTPGETIRLAHVEAEETIYEYNLWGAGIQWQDIWERDEADWEAGDAMAAIEQAWARRLMKQAYSIISDTTGVTNETYDTSGSSQLENDILTLNNAMNNILQDIYQATSTQEGIQTEEQINNPNFYVLYHQFTDDYRQRIRRAIRASFGQPNDNLSVAELDFDVTPIGTPEVATGQWYVVLPGRKNIYRTFEDLTIADVNNPLIAGGASAEVGQGRYRFLRADSNQVRTMDLS